MVGPLDTRREIETPEGVVLSERVAGPLPRALAWTVDLFARAALYLLLATGLELAGAFAGGLMLILLFALEWGYGVAFELMLNGRTPGKLVLEPQTPAEGGAAHTHERGGLRQAEQRLGVVRRAEGDEGVGARLVAGAEHSLHERGTKPRGHQLRAARAQETIAAADGVQAGSQINSVRRPGQLGPATRDDITHG